MFDISIVIVSVLTLVIIIILGVFSQWLGCWDLKEMRLPCFLLWCIAAGVSLLG